MRTDQESQKSNLYFGEMNIISCNQAASLWLAQIALLSLLIHSKVCCYPFIRLFLFIQGPLSSSKEDAPGFCNWGEDGEAGEKVKRDIVCLNKEVKLTGRVSMKDSCLTLKEDQDEVATLLWTKDGRLSGAIMATHLHTHKYCKSTHTHTWARENAFERLQLCSSLTILCLGKKNVNLPSLKGSALLNHLQPTWVGIEVECSFPQPFPPPPTHSLSLLPP